MKKLIIGIVIVGVAAGLVYFLQSKNDLADTAGLQMETPQSPTATTHAVAIQGFVFAEKSITVKKGDTVVWTNKDSAPHTVTGDNDSGIGSPTLNANGTYSFTFNSAGTFNYHCALHPNMKGAVIVE